MSDEDLKSYIKSYYLDRKMTYTKLDKHDRAIGVLLEENKQLKEDKRKAIEYIKDNYRFIDLNTGEKSYTKGGKDLLEILGDKE